MSHSMALASLTATYTDSEGEEEDTPPDGEEKPPKDSTAGDKSPESKSTPSTSPVQVKVVTKVAKLVSYHDDTAVSDEEGENGESAESNHQIIILTEGSEKSQGLDVQAVEEDGVQLPPDPLGHCSMDLQEKIVKLHEKMQNSALDMNVVIQQRKDFRNPSIYEKLIQFCGINELGTNYPPSIYDPLKWSKESYYEELAKVQKIEMDKREKERKAKMEVMTGTKKQEEDAKKRKSKWDQPGGNTLAQTLKPAGLVQPSLTNSATGTKGTVINAFGSLPKKPRI